MTDPRQRFEELLDLHLDNALSAGERAEYDALLAGHPDWAEEARQEEHLAHLLAAGRSVKAPPDLLERAFDRGIAEDSREDDKARWRGITQMGVLAAGLMVFGSIYYFTGREEPAEVTTDRAPGLALMEAHDEEDAPAAAPAPGTMMLREPAPDAAPRDDAPRPLMSAAELPSTFGLADAGAPPVLGLSFEDFAELDAALAERGLALLALTPDWDTASGWPSHGRLGRELPARYHGRELPARYHGRAQQEDGSEIALLLHGTDARARARERSFFFKAEEAEAEDGQPAPTLGELLADLPITSHWEPIPMAEGDPPAVEIRLPGRAEALEAFLRVTRWSDPAGELDPGRAVLLPAGEEWILRLPLSE